MTAIDLDTLLADHVPSVGGYCDSEIYLECSCGWEDRPPSWKTKALTWAEHLREAAEKMEEALR